MIQECDVIIKIFNSINPSTVRDYLKARVKCPEFISKYDVYRDNNAVIVELIVHNPVCFIPGCRATRWEPGESPVIDGCLDKQDFIDYISSLLKAEFDDDFEIEIDKDSYIPDEMDMIADIMEDYC